MADTPPTPTTPTTPCDDDSTTTAPQDPAPPAPRTNPNQLLCPVCWTAFTKVGRQRYCTDSCRKTAWTRRHRVGRFDEQPWGLSTSGINTFHNPLDDVRRRLWATILFVVGWEGAAVLAATQILMQLEWPIRLERPDVVAGVVERGHRALDELYALR